MNPSFPDRFRGLTDFAPMRWQCRLFEKFLENDLPAICDLPTGLGKTSVIVIWLLALLQQAEEGKIRLLRRLAYVVNRRTVVDQATDTVERIRQRLVDPGNPDWKEHGAVLGEMAGVLRGISTSNEASLGVSTLRGELADNEEWKADPARPAVIIGTIDMIGSKLLFSGYGDGRYGRVHHAGLIGHDALVIHDEAHLTPAFGDLLNGIELEQNREKSCSATASIVARPMRVIELSATVRGNKERVFTLQEDDETDLVVQDRLTAKKRARFHNVRETSVSNRIVEISKTYKESRAKVLIYVRSPRRAQEVSRLLEKSLGKPERIAILTGTMRGYERDTLVRENMVYRSLLDKNSRPEETVYLISTSAGEVGIDLDADHMICDLITLDSMIQRLGRVNRRGGDERIARVDVLADLPEKPSEVSKAMRKTMALARLARRIYKSEEGIDVSPLNVRQLLAAAKPDWIEEAFSPKPDAPPLTDVLLDAWSLTSIDNMPGRPEVAKFLHGIMHDPPETFVVWRQELTLFDEFGVDEALIREWFRDCRIYARERLHAQTDQVKKSLASALERHQKKNANRDFRVLVLDERGEARWQLLSKIVTSDFNLDHRTVVLPVAAAGIDEYGMLNADATEPNEGQLRDVAEHIAGDESRERWLHRSTPSGDIHERLRDGQIFTEFPTNLREKQRIPLNQPEEADVDSEMLDLVLLVSPAESALENPETASARQTLKEHTEAIVTEMSAVAQRLDLPASIQIALVTAARWHDKGKDRRVWQRYARNADGTESLAKSIRYLHPRALGGYRHEFGSLLDAMADEELNQCADRDLILHLVAAHHGWARPHFERRSYDNTSTTQKNNQAAREVLQRFGQLQQKYGRWGLAWLESLLRCADIAASRQAVELSSAPFKKQAQP